MAQATKIRLAVDIGGTFTDLALEARGTRFSHKILTTVSAPEKAVIDGIDILLRRAEIRAADIDILIHGTTLATNALIERKGAKTALIATRGFRDALEMAYEHRFEQYDVMLQKPRALVPRHLRLEVSERVSAAGKVLIPLEKTEVPALARILKAQDIESLAIGLLHSYINPDHERVLRDMLAEHLPGLYISISSEVCPEIREYERISTTCANAYVQPIMSGYLGRLETMLAGRGLVCPIYLMTSGGGLTLIEHARRFPIRLVESGPAGGAILAARIATECDLDEVVSFDMGGTTAKICLVDHKTPFQSRTFEVAREYRFMKGSGLPLRIPVIEMVEIGAGGGSIASVDALRRINIGPESAGSEPGPACYSRGGASPTVTDADVVLGRIDPDRFAGGTITLDRQRALEAIEGNVGARLDIRNTEAAFGISEVVEENMASAARVHAVERGKDLQRRTMVAFGGAAPLHAARLAEKLGISSVIVPAGAGVGSAIGFLSAPIAYEVVRTRYMNLHRFDPAVLNAMFADMRNEALSVVGAGDTEQELVETRTADMRYVGQGHEVPVVVPHGALRPADRDVLAAAFEKNYMEFFGRSIPNLGIEALSFTLRLVVRSEPVGVNRQQPAEMPAEPLQKRALFDPATAQFTDVPVYWRPQLAPGARVEGPAVIAEDETSTLVTAGFTARINALGYIVLSARNVAQKVHP